MASIQQQAQVFLFIVAKTNVTNVSKCIKTKKWKLLVVGKEEKTVVSKPVLMKSWVRSRHIEQLRGSSVLCMTTIIINEDFFERIKWWCKPNN